MYAWHAITINADELQVTSNLLNLGIYMMSAVQKPIIALQIWYGVGTYVSSTGTASVDYIRVYQEREPSNLIETDFKVTDKQNLGKRG